MNDNPTFTGVNPPNGTPAITSNASVATVYPTHTTRPNAAQVSSSCIPIDTSRAGDEYRRRRISPSLNAPTTRNVQTGMTSSSGYRPVLMVPANADTTGVTLPSLSEGDRTTAIFDVPASAFAVSSTVRMAVSSDCFVPAWPKYAVRVNDRNSLTSNWESEPAPEV